MTASSLSDTTEAARQYWRGALLAGGFTAIPRWTHGGLTPGVASLETSIPGGLTATLRQRGAELGVPLSSVLLAAHARVIGVLSGEPDVVTGYLATPRGRPLPCRLAAGSSSWRTLLRETHRAEWELLSYQDFPIDELRGELGLAGPSFETVFDPAGDDGKLASGTVLRVGISPDRGRLVLRLKYRTDALATDCAARITGYYLTALALIAADPEGEPGRQSLLSAEELRFQLEGLAGPRRELPDRRAHELFEQRVRAHPDAVAAVCRDRSWTYS
jgi:non-ribosomal peptide synthetase component F